jgi:predicted O-linked N-acetylglucosamine transferase (SPINDLY family)
LEPAHHLVFLPNLSNQDFFELVRLSDVYLDTFDWSGGNTSLEAAAHGIPIVTCPGRFMRGRHSTAILKRIGIEETVAADEDDYIRIAVELGSDRDFRRAVRDRMIAGLPHLYDDDECIRGLERFLETAVRTLPGQAVP